jgi:hypothetical protein
MFYCPLSTYTPWVSFLVIEVAWYLLMGRGSQTNIAHRCAILFTAHTGKYKLYTIPRLICLSVIRRSRPGYDITLSKIIIKTSS